MNNIFATGVSGTIGKHFKKQVVEIGCDLRNSKLSPLPLIKKGDYLLHAAAIVGPLKVAKDLIASYNVNVRASQMLAKIARDSDASKFIYVSTAHVYARSKSLLTEISPTEPNGIYAEQKLEAEKQITLIFKDCPEKLCIVRVFSVLDWDVADFTLGGGIKKLISDGASYTLSNVDDIRDFLTPRAVASALISITTESLLTGIVNLSTGVGLTVKDAAKIMLENSGFKIPANRLISGNSENPYVVGDNSKLKVALPNLNLEWSPSVLSNAYS